MVSFLEEYTSPEYELHEASALIFKEIYTHCTMSSDGVQWRLSEENNLHVHFFPHFLSPPDCLGVFKGNIEYTYSTP